EWITKANHVLKERLQCIKISFVVSVTNPRFTNGAQCYLFLVYWKLRIRLLGHRKPHSLAVFFVSARIAIQKVVHELRDQYQYQCTTVPPLDSGSVLKLN
ncbi:predicted protein, partial [Arabidopsis lyrata subsp. lyrata]